jgi:membrane dipeptidase
MVIDAMGDPGEFDPAADDFAPYSDRALGAIKASGVTAMNVNVCAVGNAPGRYEETVRNVAYFEREIAAHPDIFLKVRSIRDLDLAKASKRLGIVYCLQDTNILEGDLTRLGTCDALGVRAVQLTYNRRNLVGDGCLEPADGGLSGFGREVIAELNKRKILLDLSHGAPRTVMEGIGAAKAPMAITHTGCRALVDVPRNVSDTALKAMADRGGVVGIYFMPFLRTSGQAHAEDLMRHLEHAVKVCGEDHVGLGTDGVLSGYTLDAAFAEFQRKFFESRRKAGIAAPGEGPDVYNLVLEYNDPLRFKKLADDLDSRGWPAGRIEKILGSNFARLFREVWN